MMGAGVTIPGRILSAITLVSAVRPAAAPTVHLLFPCLEYRAVSVMYGELGIEKGKDIHEEGRTPSKTVFSRPAVTAAAAVLYARLTAGVFSKKGYPQGQVGVDHVICHGGNNRAVSAIEGPEAVIYREGVKNMHVRYLIHHAEVARSDCCGAAMQQLRQPVWLQSEERVSSRPAARR